MLEVNLLGSGDSVVNTRVIDPGCPLALPSFRLPAKGSFVTFTCRSLQSFDAEVCLSTVRAVMYNVTQLQMSFLYLDSRRPITLQSHLSRHSSHPSDPHYDL